jgi:hypothetical protein
MPNSNLTPAQQNLLNFLDKLASSSYSPSLMEEGNEALDAAVEEHRRWRNQYTKRVARSPTILLLQT